MAKPIKKHLVQTIITSEVHEKLLRVVERERRSVANYLRMLIEKALEKER